MCERVRWQATSTSIAAAAAAAVVVVVHPCSERRRPPPHLSPAPSLQFKLSSLPSLSPLIPSLAHSLDYFGRERERVLASMRLASVARELRTAKHLSLPPLFLSLRVCLPPQLLLSRCSLSQHQRYSQDSFVCVPLSLSLCVCVCIMSVHRSSRRRCWLPLLSG